MLTDGEKAGTFKAMLQGWLYETNAHLPAVITGVNANQTVNIRLAVKKPRMQRDGTRVFETSEIIDEVPVLLPSCNGFSLDMPLSQGCKGYVHHSDLDHDNFFLDNTDAQGVAEPHTSRQHAFNDIVFEPAFNGSIIDGEFLQLRSENTTLQIGNGHFDVINNGRSFIDTLNDAFSACRCGRPFQGWN